MELAIYEDGLHLIDKFAENNVPTFKAFCEVWKDMMFHHLYAAQTSVVEVIQTTKAVLHLAKRVVCAKDELGKLTVKLNDNRQQLRRIGGIYLMYAIYFKQPSKLYVKILMSPETWQDTRTFIETLPKDISSEVRYIFWNLYKADAFRFTALDYEVGLEDLVDYDHLCDIHKGNKAAEMVRIKLKTKLLSIDELGKCLPEMVTLEDKYNKTKQSVVGNENSAKKVLPTTTIFHDIQEALKNIHDILDEKNQQEPPTIYMNRANYNEKRKEIKRKAAGIRNKDNSEDPTVEESHHQHNNRKYYGRLTVRQIITQELPEQIMGDLRNSSSDENSNMEEEDSFEEPKDKIACYKSNTKTTSTS